VSIVPTASTNESHTGEGTAVVEVVDVDEGTVDELLCEPPHDIATSETVTTSATVAPRRRFRRPESV